MTKLDRVQSRIETACALVLSRARVCASNVRARGFYGVLVHVVTDDKCEQLDAALEDAIRQLEEEFDTGPVECIVLSARHTFSDGPECLPVPMRSPKHRGGGWSLLVDAEVRAICSEVLRLNRLGVDNAMAEFGGDSLQAMRIVALLERRCGIRLSVQDVLSGRVANAIEPR